MNEWRANYERHLRSTRWKNFRKDILRLRDRCEGCGTKHFLQVHHKTYERLGRELTTDVEVLCATCHERADREREAATKAAADERGLCARFDAGLETYASKKYGEDWADRNDYGEITEEFEEWLERKGDVGE